MRLDVARINEFLRTVVKVPLGRLTAVVGNGVGSARVSVCCGKRRPHWTVGMRRRRVPTRSVGRGGRICWRDLDLIKGDEEKCSEKRLEKRSSVCQVWDEAYEGTWAHVWLAFLMQDRAGTFLMLNTSDNHILRQSIGVHHAQYCIIRTRTSRMVLSDPLYIKHWHCRNGGEDENPPRFRARLVRSPKTVSRETCARTINVFTPITCACCYGGFCIWSD
jgi:hypothetical protein